MPSGGRSRATKGREAGLTSLHASGRLIEVARFRGHVVLATTWAISSVVDSRRDAPFMSDQLGDARRLQLALAASVGQRRACSAVSSPRRAARQLQREALDAQPEGVELGLEAFARRGRRRIVCALRRSTWRPPQYTTTPGVARRGPRPRDGARDAAVAHKDSPGFAGSRGVIAAVPREARITIHRIYQDEGRYRPQGQPGIEPGAYALYVASGHRGSGRYSILVVARVQCFTRLLIQYDLPFQFKITAFSFGFSECNAGRF